VTDEILERFAHQNEVVDDLQELVRGFYNELNEVIEKENPPAIWNMDDVGITFEPLITKTLNYKGDRNVGILSLQAHHKRMTFILMISSTGAIAPPVLLYYSKGFQQFSIEEFPEVLITNNSRGYNTEDTNYNEVLPHFLRFIEPNSMLLLDECKGHRSERISLLLKERRIRCIRLPGGTTPFLQPVDSSIGKFVKNEVRAQFIKWCTDNIDEIARQVGIGAVVFNELANSRIKDYVFSWDKVLNFDGETGPYVQYTHARIASLIRNAGGVGPEKAAGVSNIDVSYITGDSAHELAMLIYKFPSVIEDAAVRYEPSIVTRHIVDTAQAFNRYYHDEHILVDDERERAAKLALVYATKAVLKNGLWLLGMEAPEKM